MFKNTSRLVKLAGAALLLAAAVAGCGGRGGGGVAVQTGSVSGTVLTQVRTTARAADALLPGGLMPVAGATVTCEGLSADTNAEGSYTISQVPVGSRACTIAKNGFTAATFTVFVRPGQNTAAGQVSMTPSAPGALEVTSTPAGADITIDGAAAGATTPLTLDQVASGTYSISVSLTGYEPGDAQSVDVSGGATATAAFNLTLLTVSITVSPVGPLQMNTGDTQQMAATCVYYDGSSADCTSAVAWTSSNTAVATVSAGGLLTSLGSGQTVITASRLQSGATSAGLDVTVSGSFSEPDCAGEAGVCLDMVGASATAGNPAVVYLAINNPPAGGLGAGEAYISWDASLLTLASASPEAGITIEAQETSAGTGVLKAVFTSANPITAAQNLMALQFNVAPGATGQAAVSLSTGIEQTNLADNNAAVVSQPSITFRNGYLNIGP